MSKYEQRHSNRPFNLQGDIPGQERINTLREKEGELIRESPYNFQEGEYAVPETGYNNYDTYRGDDEGRRWDGSRGGRSMRPRDFNSDDEFYERNSRRRANDFNDPKYYGERFASQHANEQAYRGIESSDRGRRNSVYRNPDFGSRADFEGNRYRDLGIADERRVQSSPGDFETYYRSGSMRAGHTNSHFGRDRGHTYPGMVDEYSHRGKGPKNYTRSDSRIQEDANDALYDSHSVDASDIEVSVTDGVLILSGTVDSRYAKRNAESAVDYISGIKNIENRIHVRSTSAPHSQRANNTNNEKKGTNGSSNSKDTKPHTGTLP